MQYYEEKPACRVDVAAAGMMGKYSAGHSDANIDMKLTLIHTPIHTSAVADLMRSDRFRANRGCIHQMQSPLHSVHEQRISTAS